MLYTLWRKTVTAAQTAEWLNGRAKDGFIQTVIQTETRLKATFFKNEFKLITQVDLQIACKINKCKDLMLYPL